MFPPLGSATGFSRRIAPSASIRLTRAVAVSLVLAEASLWAILALKLLSAHSGAALLAL